MKALLILLLAAVVVTFTEARCKYQRPRGNIRPECDETGHRSITLHLKEGEDPSCPPTKTLERLCDEDQPGRGGRRPEQQGSGRKTHGRGRGRGKGKGEHRSRVITDPDGCQFGKGEGAVITRCAPGERHSAVTLVLLEGPEGCPNTLEVNRTCRGRPGHRVRPSHAERPQNDAQPGTEVCNYTQGDWTECGEGNRFATRTDTLIETDQTGDCEQTRVLRRRCNRGQKQDRKSERQQAKAARQAAKAARLDGEESREVSQTEKQQRKSARLEKKNARQEQRAARMEGKAAREATKVAKQERKAARRASNGSTEELPQNKCEYIAGNWSSCGETDGIRTRIDMLNHSSEGVQCEETITRTKNCRPSYRRGRKNDATRLQKTEAKAQRKADRRSHDREEKLVSKAENQERRAKKRNQKAANNAAASVPAGCDYIEGNWTACQDGDRKRTRVDVLVTSPEGIQCEATLTHIEGCKQGPRRERERGTKTDNRAGRRERRLEKMARKAEKRQGEIQKQEGLALSRPQAPINVTHTVDARIHPQPEIYYDRKNKTATKCRYNAAEWSPCVNDQRTMVRSLTDESPSHCSPQRRRSVPCHTARGKEKCFFGQWGPFGDCHNGVRTKLRPVIGGEDIDMCQRKAVQTQSCCVGPSCETDDSAK